MAADIVRVGPLAQLSEEEARVLTDCSRPRAFKVDETVLEQGQLNGSLFVVLTGLLHVRRRAEGRSVLLGRLEPGAFFGDISIFDPGPTTADVIGVGPGTLIEITSEHLDQFMAVQPGAAARLLRALLEEMAHRLRRTDERLVEAIFWGGLLR